MTDPKIRYDIEANAIGETEVKALADSVKVLGDALDKDLKREADAAAQALKTLGSQSAAASAFQSAGKEALQAGAAFKDAQSKLKDLDQKFAEAAAAARQFATAESEALQDVRATTRELDQAKLALAQVDSSYDKAGRGTAEYAAATGALKVSIAKLTSDLREKKNTLQDAARAAKEAEREESALAQQHQKLGTEVSRTRKAYEEANRALDEAKTTLKGAGVDAGNFASEQRRLASETESARKAVLGLTASFTGMAQAKEAADEAAKAGKAISQAFGTLGVRSAADLRSEIAQVRAAMQTVEKDAGLTGATLKQALGAGNGRLRELQRELRSVQGELTLADRASGLLRTGLAQIAGGNIIANAIGAIGSKAQDMGREFLEANLQMEGTRRALNAVYKDANVTASQIDFLRKTANEAGVSAGGLSDSFKSFSASTKAANIPLETTNALFASVTKAGATLGLSGERVSLVLQALGQMAAKGTVSMEELRQQLGESLPGALSLSAKGLGLTEAQLIKLVESGGLAARDLFPALAKSLREMQGETEGVTSSWERLKNALTISSQNAGDAGGMQLLTLSIKALGAVVAAVVLPLAAFAEVVFGVAKAAGVLVGSLVTLTNPLQELGEIADAASARQSALTDSFKALVFGADATAASQAKAGAAIAQTGRDAGAAAVGVGQVAQAHGAAAGAALTNVTAQNAAAIAAKIAGNASMDAGAKWVQLGVQLREIAAAQDQQIKNAEKLASAAKIEGDGLQALAALRGNDLESLQAASAASEANAAALDKVAAAREAQLATLSAELNAKKALIAGNAEEQKARETELQEIQKKIDALSAEASAGRAAAEAAKTDAAARRAAVGAYQDNAAAVGALRMALEQARIVQEAFESDRRRGLATDQQVEEAKRRTAEAQRLYNDALNDAVAAEQRSAAAKTSALQLERAGLDLQMAQARAAETKAIADRNEYAATQARIKQKEIEIAAIKLVAAQLKAEADGMDAVTNKKIEALVLEGKWTDALAAEMQILRQSAEAKRKQAEETETSIAQRERELKALREGKFAHEDLARGMRNESSARFENQQAMRAQEDAMDRLNMRYKLSADYSERQIALLEREAAAAEKAAEAKRRYWNVDKDGFTLDANGQRQQMSVPTGEFVFQAAKSAGLSEEEALALMDKYFQNGKPTGVAQRNGINGPSRDWFSIVNEAISKAVIDKARENTGKPAANEGTGTMQGGATVSESSGRSVTRVVNMSINYGRTYPIPTTAAGEQNLQELARAVLDEIAMHKRAAGL